MKRKYKRESTRKEEEDRENERQRDKEIHKCVLNRFLRTKKARNYEKVQLWTFECIEYLSQFVVINNNKKPRVRQKDQKNQIINFKQKNNKQQTLTNTSELYGPVSEARIAVCTHPTQRNEDCTISLNEGLLLILQCVSICGILLSVNSLPSCLLVSICTLKFKSLHSPDSDTMTVFLVLLTLNVFQAQTQWSLLWLFPRLIRYHFPSFLQT